jgi:hypothetical protein
MTLFGNVISAHTTTNKPESSSQPVVPKITWGSPLACWQHVFLHFRDSLRLFPYSHHDCVFAAISDPLFLDRLSSLSPETRSRARWPSTYDRGERGICRPLRNGCVRYVAGRIGLGIICTIFNECVTQIFLPGTLVFPEPRHMGEGDT